MSSRVLVLALALSVGPVAFSFAQNTAPNYDRLERLLEKKYRPVPEQRRFDRGDRRNFDWIRPKTEPRRPLNDGLLTPELRPNAFTAAHFGAALQSLRYRVADAGAARRVTSDAARLPLLAQATPTQTQPNASPGETSPSTQTPANTDADQTRSRQQQVAPARPPVPGQQVPLVAHNSYIIMLKPDATEAQINALLSKYHLRPTKVIAKIGLLRVEREGVAAAGPEDSSPHPAEDLPRMLSPQIIKDLRNESIIDSAFVETNLRPRSVPQAQGTTVNGDSIVFTWHWNDGLIPVLTPEIAAKPQPQDGNWGLKAMRLPTAWTILERYRATHAKQAKPKLAFIDSGFAKHEDLSFSALRSPDGTSAPNVALTSSVTGNMCEMAHGNHVAGIAAAIWGNRIGIDGALPQAKVDAVPFTSTDKIEDKDLEQVLWQQRTSLFMDVLADLGDYLVDSALNPDGLRVVNISLGYNFIADGLFTGDPNQIPDLKAHIAEEAKPFAHLIQRFPNVLFVTAAGNDSGGLAVPYDTKWSSPITWAATQAVGGVQLKNVLVVEASDRNGLRADFSNIGGDVSAPGVNILSTWWPGGRAYGVCSGTSQAAPHVAALATLLFELDPKKTAADVVGIIKASAIKQASGSGAPNVDALEAVLKLSPDNLTRLADLDKDGKVDSRDLAIFAKQITAIINNRNKGTPFTEDLNGDGVIDGNECSWPSSDLNGSGVASLSSSDARPIQGVMRTDLQVMQLAWTDKHKDFNTALHESGLDAMMDASSATAISSGKGCR